MSECFFSFRLGPDRKLYLVAFDIAVGGREPVFIAVERYPATEKQTGNTDRADASSNNSQTRALEELVHI